MCGSAGHQQTNVSFHQPQLVNLILFKQRLKLGVHDDTERSGWRRQQAFIIWVWAPANIYECRLVKWMNMETVHIDVQNSHQHILNRGEQDVFMLPLLSGRQEPYQCGPKCQIWENNPKTNPFERLGDINPTSIVTCDDAKMCNVFSMINTSFINIGSWPCSCIAGCENITDICDLSILRDVQFQEMTESNWVIREHVRIDVKVSLRWHMEVSTITIAVLR